MLIGQTGAAPPLATLRGAARRRGESFAVAEHDAPEAAELPASPALAQAGAVVLMAAAPAGERRPADPTADRQAAGHGQAMLGALAGLQAAALGSGGASAQHALAELARNLPEVADTGLGAVLQAIAQRAAVELARSA